MHVDFKDLLAKYQIDPAGVLMLRHTPKEPGLREMLPWLAANRPAVFNAYQQSQSGKVEPRMKKAMHVASFIGLDDGSTLFVGLYQRRGEEERTPEGIRSIPEVQELLKYGLHICERSPQLWFDLRLRDDFFGVWKGRLTIGWPSAGINWHRFADRADFEITTIHPESLLREKSPDSYRGWDLRWDQLTRLPESWQAKLRGWRGIYFIFDVSDGKGYIGKASGAQNLLGRWLNYKETGDGGNVKLRGRDPTNFRFSILELVPEDADDETIEQREQNWMQRLRTRTRTHGLNLPELDY